MPSQLQTAAKIDSNVPFILTGAAPVDWYLHHFAMGVPRLWEVSFSDARTMTYLDTQIKPTDFEAG